MNERLKEAVDLALLANSGFVCECDPDVGMAPCRGCAIDRALRLIQESPPPITHQPNKDCRCELCDETATIEKILSILKAQDYKACANWLLRWFNAKNERITELEAELKRLKERDDLMQ